MDTNHILKKIKSEEDEKGKKQDLVNKMKLVQIEV